MNNFTEKSPIKAAIRYINGMKLSGSLTKALVWNGTRAVLVLLCISMLIYMITPIASSDLDEQGNSDGHMAYGTQPNTDEATDDAYENGENGQNSGSEAMPGAQDADHLPAESGDDILTNSQGDDGIGADDTDNAESILYQEEEEEFPYLIYVSKDSFTIAILGLDDEGEYTEVLKTFHTAVGRTSAQTRAGTYTIISRTRWVRWGRNSFSPYATRHSGGLWFHGPLYNARDSYRLNPRSFNAIGSNATAGCMRTTTGASAWIYYHVPDGTTVIIANDSLYTSTPVDRIDSSQRFDPTDPNLLIESVNMPFESVSYYD